MISPSLRARLLREPSSDVHAQQRLHRLRRRSQPGSAYLTAAPDPVAFARLLESCVNPSEPELDTLDHALDLAWPDAARQAPPELVDSVTQGQISPLWRLVRRLDLARKPHAASYLLDHPDLLAPVSHLDLTGSVSYRRHALIELLGRKEAGRLRTLILDGNTLGGRYYGREPIHALFSHAPFVLNELRLNDCYLVSEDLDQLAQYNATRHLNALSLAGLQTQDLSALCHLSQLNQLKTLQLGAGPFLRREAHGLCDLLNTLSPLKNLHVHNTQHGFSDLDDHLAVTLKHRRLGALSLVQCGITPTLLACFARRQTLHSVTELDLSGNPVTIPSLLAVLDTTPHLRSLRLHKIDDLCLETLDALLAHPTLQQLDHLDLDLSQVADRSLPRWRTWVPISSQRDAFLTRRHTLRRAVERGGHAPAVATLLSSQRDLCHELLQPALELPLTGRYPTLYLVHRELGDDTALSLIAGLHESGSLDWLAISTQHALPTLHQRLLRRGLKGVQHHVIQAPTSVLETLPPQMQLTPCANTAKGYVLRWIPERDQADVRAWIRLARRGWSQREACAVFDGRFGDADLQRAFRHAIRPDAYRCSVDILERSGLGPAVQAIPADLPKQLWDLALLTSLPWQP